MFKSLYEVFFLLTEQAAYLEVEILSPTNKEQFADEGNETSLDTFSWMSQHKKTIKRMYFLKIFWYLYNYQW